MIMIYDDIDDDEYDCDYNDNLWPAMTRCTGALPLMVQPLNWNLKAKGIFINFNQDECYLFQVKKWKVSINISRLYSCQWVIIALT